MSNIQYSARIHGYADAADYLGKKTERPIAHNTRVIRRDDNVIVIRFHETPVVEYFPRGMMDGGECTVLNSGGWMTSTTKERLNSFIPAGFSIWQERGQWTLTRHDSHPLRWESFPWADGITIDQSGHVHNAGTVSDVNRKKKMGRDIRKYVSAYVAALAAGKVPAPSGGDCWYCYLREVKTGTPMGELGGGNKDHLLNHMEESYFVPSLLTRAFEVTPMCQISMGTLGQLWGYTDGTPSTWGLELLNRDAARSLAKYLKAQLGIAA